MNSFELLVATLRERGVRYVVVEVWGANYYARSGATLFATQDRDLFLPPEPPTLLTTWNAAQEVGFELWAGSELLEQPVDIDLAERVTAAKARTEAVHPDGEQVDLMLDMAGFDFESVWRERRTFRVRDLEVPVARLLHIVQSKAAADRPKDRLFLETYRDLLAELTEDDR